ncbi:unnamed protein product [Camellia sinensis]
MEQNRDTLSEEGYLPGTLLHLIKSITEMGLLAADLVLYLEIPPEGSYEARRDFDFDLDLQRAAERGGYGGERYEQLDASWKSQKKLYEKHHNTADGRIRIWLGIRQIMNSTDYLLTETRDTAKELKTGIHIEVCYARLHPRALRPEKKIK